MVQRTAIVMAIVYFPVRFALGVVPVWALLSVGASWLTWLFPLTAAVSSYVLAAYLVDRFS